MELIFFMAPRSISDPHARTPATHTHTHTHTLLIYNDSDTSEQGQHLSLFIDKTLIHRLVSFKAALKVTFGP